VGTGAFSTDVGIAANTATSSLLAGRIVKPLIADQDSKMGVRCGLLNSINNLTSTCVTGALAGVGATTNALGLGVLNTALGVDRAQLLNTWSMAPPDAIAAWLTEAKTSGFYYESPITGVGNVRTKTVPVPAAGADCFSGTPTSAQVIFIEQVGNGEQYCNVRSDATAKILVVRRGGVRVSAHFTGVVYALNQQECTNADGTCSTADRANAVPREVVRIEGNTGYVTGSVWADGAGGSVGIYPSLNLTGTGPNSSLLNVGGANGICSLPVLGPVLNTLGTSLAGLTSVVGNILPLVTGTQEEVRYPNGGSAPTGCSLLKAWLGGLTTSQLLNVFGSGGSTTVVLSERRTRTCTTLATLCALNANLWGPWSAWSTRDSAAVTVSALLSTGTPSVIEQVAGVLGATLNSYTAITYNAAAVSNASAQISQGAAPVVGTYRNLGPATT
jgi:antitoxin component HigA of HigAB toxin-antitoxin module